MDHVFLVLPVRPFPPVRPVRPVRPVTLLEAFVRHFSRVNLQMSSQMVFLKDAK